MSTMYKYRLGMKEIQEHLKARTASDKDYHDKIYNIRKTILIDISFALVWITTGIYRHHVVITRLKRKQNSWPTSEK